MDKHLFEFIFSIKINKKKSPYLGDFLFRFYLVTVSFVYVLLRNETELLPLLKSFFAVERLYVIRIPSHTVVLFKFKLSIHFFDFLFLIAREFRRHFDKYP